MHILAFRVAAVARPVFPQMPGEDRCASCVAHAVQQPSLAFSPGDRLPDLSPPCTVCAAAAGGGYGGGGGGYGGGGYGGGRRSRSRWAGRFGIKEHQLNWQAHDTHLCSMQQVGQRIAFVSLCACSLALSRSCCRQQPPACPLPLLALTCPVQEPLPLPLPQQVGAREPCSGLHCAVHA